MLGPILSVRFSLQTNNHPLKKKNDSYQAHEEGTNVRKVNMLNLKSLNVNNHLIHAWNCQDFNCITNGCAEMKKLIVHSHDCEMPECRTCKKNLVLCYYHAWVCENDVTCKLPFCSTLWQKMDLQLKFQRTIKDIEGFAGDRLKEKLPLNSTKSNDRHERKFLKRQALV